jgi:hypothetical protein
MRPRDRSNRLLDVAVDLNAVASTGEVRESACLKCALNLEGLWLSKIPGSGRALHTGGSTEQEVDPGHGSTLAHLATRRWWVKPAAAIVEVEAQRRNALAEMATPVTADSTATERRDQNGCKHAAESDCCNCDRSKWDAQVFV